MNKHTLWLIPILLLLAACQQNESAQIEPKAVATIKASSAIAQEITVPIWLTTGGSVTTDHRVTVSSRLSGYIRALKLREGKTVQQGDLLFRIDPVDVTQALNQAKADAANALAEKKRYASLLKAQAVTRQQYDNVALRYTLARSRVKQAQNQLRYTDVRAALDGVVVSKLMHNGDLASPGQPVLVIENPQQLLVETHVSEAWVGYLHEGDQATLKFSGQIPSMRASIDHIIEDEQRNSHQFMVKLSLTANQHIRPGMFVHINFLRGERTALVIPQTAIVHRNGLTGVYRVTSDGLLRYQLVRLGETYDDMVEVSSGLQAGERIISDVNIPMHSGMKLLEDGHA